MATLANDMDYVSIVGIRKKLADDWNVPTEWIGYTIKADKYDPHVAVIYRSKLGHRHTEYFSPDKE